MFPFTTSVITVHPSMTWPGVLEKLSQAPGRRVILVLSRRNALFRSAPRLQALQQAALAQGKRVALVTHDEAVVRAARLANIPTFGSAWRARWFPWGWAQPRRLPSRPTAPAAVYAVAHVEPPLPRWGPVPRPVREGAEPVVFATLRSWLAKFQVAIIAFLVAGLFAMALGTLFLLVPWASVYITPAPQEIRVSLNLTAHPGVEEADLELRVVPARFVEVIVEDSAYAAATGRRWSPSAKAQGKVVFTNRVGREVLIPEGTRVRTATAQAVEFVTLEPATLPPERGARVEVPIEAVEPGPQGNVRAFTISEVVGPLAIDVAVTNPEPTTGGGVREVSVVTAQDKETARREALRALTAKAIAELAQKQQPGEFIPRESIQTIVLAETYDRFAGEEADKVGVTLRLLVRGVAVDGAAAEALVLRALREALPPAGRLVRDSTHITIGPVTAWDPTTHTVYFAARGRGLYVLDISEDEVRNAIAGKSVQEAATILQTRWQLAAPPAIYLGPDWLVDQPWLPKAWRERMPAHPGRILVTVDLEGALREAGQ